MERSSGRKEGAVIYFIIRMILKLYKGPTMGLVLAIAVAGCANSAAPVSDRPLVVATTSIWGDLVGRVVGDSASVEVLIPRGADPHDYQPSSRQVARLREASLVVANGFDLEESLVDVLDAAISDGVTVAFMGDAITPRSLAGSDQPDPHFWTDPNLVRETLPSLVDALSTATDLPSGTLNRNADSLAGDLDSLDATLSEQASAVPQDRRQLVTTHDSLGYFAAAYGYEVVGVAVAGGSTLASPSASDLNNLVQLINSRTAPAIFVDSGQFQALAEALATSTEAQVVPIAVAALGDKGSDTDSYFSMMLTLGTTIGDALS